MTTFQELGLDDRIVQAMQRVGYTNPTPIQAQTIGVMIGRDDLVASSPTGSGKTAAFVLPALQHLIQSQPRTDQPRVLILTPTRELATQIAQVIHQATRDLRFIKTAILVGGSPYGPQLKALRQGASVIIATPGRLMDHLNSGQANLSHVDLLILDEADRMLDMGFIDDIAVISRHIPKRRQTVLFSATLPPRLHEIIENLLKPTRVRVDLMADQPKSPVQIDQKIYYADNPDHKHALFERYLNEEPIFKAIIFSATKLQADQLSEQLHEWGYKAAPLHGDLNQRKRERTLKQLREGKIQFLVATDVASRGIDVPDISHVINYDIPKFTEDYIHRIGRTGRAGKSGIAVSFALHSDLRPLIKIQRFTQHTISRMTFPGMEPQKAFDRPAPTRSRPTRPEHRRGSGPAYAHREPRETREPRTGGYAAKRSGPSFGEQRPGFRPAGSKPKRPGTPTAGRSFGSPTSAPVNRSAPANRGTFANRPERSERPERQAGPLHTKRPAGRPGEKRGGNRADAYPPPRSKPKSRNTREEWFR